MNASFFDAHRCASAWKKVIFFSLFFFLALLNLRDHFFQLSLLFFFVLTRLFLLSQTHTHTHTKKKNAWVTKYIASGHLNRLRCREREGERNTPFLFFLLFFFVPFSVACAAVLHADALKKKKKTKASDLPDCFHTSRC